MSRKICGKGAPMWILLTRWLMNNGFEKCQLCGTKENLTFDHIVPYSKSGKREQGNLAILCGDCNVKKDNNYFPLDPCPWPNPAFPQVEAENLQAGLVTIYGRVTNIKRFKNRSGDDLLEISLCGDSIAGHMRNKQISSTIVRKEKEIVLLDPRFVLV